MHKEHQGKKKDAFEFIVHMLCGLYVSARQTKHTAVIKQWLQNLLFCFSANVNLERPTSSSAKTQVCTATVSPERGEINNDASLSAASLWMI